MFGDASEFIPVSVTEDDRTPMLSKGDIINNNLYKTGIQAHTLQ